MDEIVVDQKPSWKRLVWPVCFVLLLSFGLLFAEKWFFDFLRNPKSIAEYPGLSNFRLIFMFMLDLAIVGSFASIVFEKIEKLSWKFILLLSCLLFLLTGLFAFSLLQRSPSSYVGLAVSVWSAFISVISFWALYFLVNFAKKIPKNFLLIIVVLSLTGMIVKPYFDYYTEPIYIGFEGIIVFAEKISQKEALSIIEEYGLTQYAIYPAFDGKTLYVVSRHYDSNPDPWASKNQTEAEIKMLSTIISNNDLIESVQFSLPGELTLPTSDSPKLTLPIINHPSSRLELREMNAIETMEYTLRVENSSTTDEITVDISVDGKYLESVIVPSSNPEFGGMPVIRTKKISLSNRSVELTAMEKKENKPVSIIVDPKNGEYIYVQYNAYNTSSGVSGIKVFQNTEAFMYD
ncbi:MAG: hypothetical protein WC873_00730 [Candidatus Gracilibacteria bacterium]